MGRRPAPIMRHTGPEQQQVQTTRVWGVLWLLSAGRKSKNKVDSLLIDATAERYAPAPRYATGRKSGGTALVIRQMYLGQLEDGSGKLESAQDDK